MVKTWVRTFVVEKLGCFKCGGKYKLCTFQSLNMLPKLLTPGEDMRETIINSHTSEVIRYMLTKIHTPPPPPPHIMQRNVLQILQPWFAQILSTPIWSTWRNKGPNVNGRNFTWCKADWESFVALFPNQKGTFACSFEWNTAKCILY
jgi:hypothetical protein